VRGTSGGLSHGRDILLLSLGDRGGGGGLLPVDDGEVGVAARHGRQDDGEP
jgi:hypothetical protein